jgi:hypothetical protein
MGRGPAGSASPGGELGWAVGLAGTAAAPCFFQRQAAMGREAADGAALGSWLGEG